MPAWVASPVHRAAVEALIEARKAAGLTQRDLALRIGKPHSFIGKLESIERNCSITEWLAIAHATGLSIPDALAELIAHLPDRVEI